ncbi:hypothetical protein GRI58_10295 [Porphyrobacter algicida]|uniref:Uncharacterized protein n=2 Tax=Qipengyuania algicida TaxID=1836209 RepID=A0A845AG40_9SPHN|nr:hypothetical protein [Qipengyuania algicida]
MLFAIVLFVVWASGFLVFSYFILGGLLFGKLGLSTDYEFPFMGVMLLICLLSFSFLVDFMLRKVAR